MRRGSGAGTDPNDPTYRWWETTHAEQDHAQLPIGRRWHVAGTIIGVVVALIVVTVISVERGDDTIEFEPLGPPVIETEPTGSPRITDVEVEVGRADGTQGRVRVSGDDLVRVDLTGSALCEPVAGAPGVWLEVGFCASTIELAIEGQDDDGETTVAVARF